MQYARLGTLLTSDAQFLRALTREALRLLAVWLSQFDFGTELGFRV